jgi:molecular chaperone GrpE
MADDALGRDEPTDGAAPDVGAPPDVGAAPDPLAPPAPDDGAAVEARDEPVDDAAEQAVEARDEPVDDAAEPVDDAAEQVETDLAALLAERDQFKDIALRLQADFENYRRRVSTQTAGDIDRATGRLIESLLPVLDACEAAFGHGVDGIEPIWSALLGALQKHGLEALDLQDKPFDPEVAEAVVHEPGLDDVFDVPMVAEILRTGYRWKGRVLRPAMVKVKG